MLLALLTAFEDELLALASGDKECDDCDDCDVCDKSRTDSAFDIPGFLLARV